MEDISFLGKYEEYSRVEIREALDKSGVYFVIIRQNKQDFAVKLSKDDAICLAKGILGFFPDRTLDVAIRTPDDKEVETVVVNKSFFADWTFFRVFLNAFNKLFSFLGFVKRLDNPTDECSDNNTQNFSKKKHKKTISKTKRNVKE